MSLLFTPLTIRDVTFKNRLWVSPMCQYSAVDGMPDDWHYTHLTQFAIGGSGLIFTEAAAVVPEGRIAPPDAGIWNDGQRDAWRRIVDGIHARGARAGMQLSHAGRKSSIWWPFSGSAGTVAVHDGGWTAEAPSEVAYDGYATPAALRPNRIGEIVDAFRSAARRAADAGFDVVEIHAAHGYLLHQFLSPLTNTRADEWGGTLENRARIIIEIVRAVRTEVGGGMPIFVRFSATDSAPGGLETDEVALVAGWALAAGADLTDVTTSGLVKHQAIDVFPGYQVVHSARVRALTGGPTSAVGIITSGAQAEEILQSGSADAVFAAREFLRDPHFVLRAATELGEDPNGIWPPQYLRAFREWAKVSATI